MLRSLNELYRRRNAIHFFCDAAGNLNGPDDVRVGYVMPEDYMSEQELDLYRNYWQPGDECSVYVLRIEGNAYIGLVFPFGRDLAAGIAKKRTGRTSVSEEDMNMLFRTMTNLSFMVQQLVPECDVFLGENTGVDGHEILVAVPYAERQKVSEYVKKIGKTLYRVMDAVIAEEK